MIPVIRLMWGGAGPHRSLERRDSQTGATDEPRCTVGELRKNIEKAHLIRMEKQKQEIKRREKRNAYLKNISIDFPKAWSSVKKATERGSGRGYDEACHLLVDIAEAYDLFATKKQFQKELKRFMAGHLRRKALIERLMKAGLWNDK